MSRGPGKWQRVLLDAVTSRGWVSVSSAGVAFLNRSMTASEYSAVTRAAHLLARNRKIVLRRMMGRGYDNRGNVRLVAINVDCAPNASESTYTPDPNCLATAQEIREFQSNVAAFLAAKVNVDCDPNAARSTLIEATA